jgi:predicted Zn-dependent protease with MMP-like domain
MWLADKQLDVPGRILKIKDFNEAFELVKLAVNSKFNMHRAGLSLILQGLPSRIGAYHILGSNVIVVNRTILNMIRQHKSIQEYNSYLFMVLVHEYLHSFGIIDELGVRQMTFDLCSSLLGIDHPASIMAKGDPSALFPELALLKADSIDEQIEVIKNFDKTTQSYIQ